MTKITQNELFRAGRSHCTVYFEALRPRSLLAQISISFRPTNPIASSEDSDKINSIAFQYYDNYLLIIIMIFHGG